ncbi:hypothetical protein, conserved [Plasmodium gonderi]|uniref:Uncharacterized protein n=1 Tax=Plasmodium gonderi TaxID=77519 RepID=A0A1Y1JQE6_PLAGO|nr:hypothetical protein, conserved [Plasmodium gonderi]GAW83715.1 hypothetical protein, conserved [Plasmodium gonderi]
MSPLCRTPHDLLRSALKRRYQRKNIFLFSFKQLSHKNVVKKKNCTDQVKADPSNFFKVLQNEHFLPENMDKLGTFTCLKERQNLIYERVIFKPTSYVKLCQFVQMLEKENFLNEFDIYFFEENLDEIKLNRNQNRKEIFIDVKHMGIDKNITLGRSIQQKNCKPIEFLQKYNIQPLLYYNIQRYEANEDPSSFLIDRKRLTKGEYRYQYVSTILPYICFTLMLFFPHFLIFLYIPYIKKKNEKQRQLCKIFQIKQNIHLYKDIKPEYLQNIIDNNMKTLVLFYNNEIFMNMHVKSLMIDLSKILKKNSIPVNVIGIDTSKYNIRYNVTNDFEETLFPVLYFVLPYHYDNDSAVFQIKTPLTLENICLQMKDFVHVPPPVFRQIQDLSKLSGKLQKCIFEHEVMNKKKEEILYDYGTEIAHLSCLHLNSKVSF